MRTAAMLEAALDYCARGWSIVPLHGKTPYVKWSDWQTQRADRHQVEAWWAQWPDAGIGLVLGPASGLVRVDADSSTALDKLREMFGELPATPEFKTPRGGHGWLMRYADGLETEVLWKGSGDHEELRFMSLGSYTVVPPSQTADGVYTWTRAPWEVDPAETPTRVVSALRSCKAARVVRELEQELRGTVDQPDKPVVLAALEQLDADDYDRWVQVGMALKSLGDDMLSVWDEWSQRSPKWKAGECERKWSSFSDSGGLTGRSIVFWAMQTGWRPPIRYTMTDTGNAARLVDANRELMRFCHPWEKWLVWDGARWREDDTGAAVRNAKQVFEQLFDEALAEFGRATEAAKKSDSFQLKKQLAEKLLGHAIKSQDRRRIEAALFLAQCELPVLPMELDSDPWLFNCANGTLDLRTFELRPHNRNDMLTKLCPTPYTPGAECPRWLSFLHEVFDSESLVEWVQRLLGYCLTGATTEHVLPILWGRGANGKSTVVQAVFNVLGPDYTGKAPKELLVAKQGNVHPTVYASLFGKRFIAAVETDDNSRLDEVVIKELTGGDAVTCRRMHEDFWTYTPTHKILLATNHQPEVRGTDHAIWRRLRLVPFLVTFSEDKQDRLLSQKLKAEAPGVLGWMVEGCKRWQRDGLGEAPSIRQATQKYRSEQDRVEEFLKLHYERADGCRVRVSELTSKYSAWCRINREPELSSRQLSASFAERGINRDASKKFFDGLKEV